MSGTAARTRRPRVVYWNNIPAPYLVGRFNAVARRGNVDLEAWFSARTEADRSWVVDESTWDFRSRYVNRVGPGSRLVIPPVRSFGRHRPDLLVSLYASPSFLGGWELARLAGVRTAFRVLPTFDAWVARHPVKERIKRFAFSRVDAVKVPGPAGAAVASAYGVPADRIHVVTQSIDVEAYRSGYDRWHPERDAIRTELGLTGCTFLYVGRLWEGKGLTHLLAAFAAVLNAGVDATLLLAGDGVDEPTYRTMAAEPPLRGRVIFTGFVQQDTMPRIQAASDVLVFPTLGDPHGLVVEEAMASHLPVVVTTAAGDIERRLPDGDAGFIVPPADAVALADRMLVLARDPALRIRFAERGAELVAGQTHDRYAEDFERFVDAVLEAPRRSASERRL
jgi:glycosyltransferase involved in cell wall biosynthesis